MYCSETKFFVPPCPRALDGKALYFSVFTLGVFTCCGFFENKISILAKVYLLRREKVRSEKQREKGVDDNRLPVNPADIMPFGKM